ncbi:hypothetical protein [Paenibacillus sp.]|nr:hypothetical protein [Paenibacillus sp.]
MRSCRKSNARPSKDVEIIEVEATIVEVEEGINEAASGGPSSK